MQTKWFKEVLVLVFILSFSCLWFFREIFQGCLFFYSDLTYYFYPYRFFMVESIKAGTFPLWNPYIYAGYPFFATLQHGILYPISLIYYLFPFDLAFNLAIIIHYPLAFIFTYLLCRELKMSRSAAIISGLAFAFSGFLLSVLHMPTTLAAATWLPLVLLFFRRVLRAEDFWISGKNLIWTVCFLTLMFLGGEPTVLFGTVLFIFLYICYINFERGEGNFLKNTSLLFIAGIIFLFLTAIQVIPFLELLSQSLRSSGASFGEASYWSLNPLKLLSFIFPFLFNSAEYSYATFEWTKSFYMGTTTIILAFFSMLFMKSKKHLSLALIFSFLLAFGSYTPFYQLFYKTIPFLSFVRYPQKFLLFSSFFLALLAGFGFDGFLLEIEKEESEKIKKFLTGLLIIIILFFILFAVIFLNPKINNQITRALLFEELNKAPLINIPRLAIKNMANLAILCFIIIFTWLLFAAFQRFGNKPILRVLLLMILAGDLLLANYGMNLSIKAESYHQISPNIEILKKDPGIFRVCLSPPLQNACTYWISDEVNNFNDGIVDLRNLLICNQPIIYHLQLLDGYESIVNNDVFMLQMAIRGLAGFKGVELLNLLNFKYLLINYPFNQEGYVLVNKSKMKLRQMDLYLYKNEKYHPRAFIVPGYRIMNNRDKILKYISFPSFPARTEAVLEEIPLNFVVSGKSMPDPYQARILSYAAEKVVIDASLKKTGILFLSDHFYPGWKAYVDGKETKIYRANYMFRAVPLTHGNHKVVFSYEPLSFKLGAVISCITLLGIGGFLIAANRRRAK